MAKNKTIKKNYIRPKLHKAGSKTKTRPKLYKSTSRTRTNKKNKNKNISRSRSNSRLNKYVYGGGKKLKGGTDPEVDPVFKLDNQTKGFSKPGKLYGTRYDAQQLTFTRRPEDETIFGLKDKSTEKLYAKRIKHFFSPYSSVNTGKWKGWLDSNNFWVHDEDAGFITDKITDKSRKLVKNIKKLDKQIEELRKSIETSTETVNKENLSKAINLINEKNSNITDLQIHRLDEGFGEYGTASINVPKPDHRHQADFTLQKYVFQCIIRLKYPNYEFNREWELNSTKTPDFNIDNFTISKEEEQALESLKNTPTNVKLDKLFEKIKDIPIIPIEFAWLLDERIVKNVLHYNLFGKNGIFERILTKDGNPIEEIGHYRYVSEEAHKVFLKIWTANVIVKYIFKIYHEVSYSYIKGENYPTIETIRSEMPITKADEPSASLLIQEESPSSKKPFDKTNEYLEKKSKEKTESNPPMMEYGPGWFFE